jgi:antitoxin component YwqK of YwqJK toxin-antitoxin module
MRQFIFISIILISSISIGQTTKRTNDTITSSEKYYNEQGRVRCEIIQLDKVPDKQRHIICYGQNGQKTKDFFEKDNVKYDTLREWTEDGKLNHMEIYADSGFTTIDYWPETGRILETGQYKFSTASPDNIIIYDSATFNKYTSAKCDYEPCYIRIGIWKEYHENGVLASEGKYLPINFKGNTPSDSAGIKVSNKKTSFEMIPSVSYITWRTNSIKDGLWKYYDEKGIKIKEELYENGLLKK